MTRFRLFSLALLVALCTVGGCSSLKPRLAKESPPLIDMEAPLDLQDEPRDEELRQKLPPGSFSGLYVEAAGESLDEMLDEEGGGVLVTRVVENSPGAAARIREGDILVEATVNDGETIELSWPSVWRDLELKTPAGSPVKLLLDRAGQDFETTLILEERLAPAPRTAMAAFREEQKVGVVLRTPTEVEARHAGLAPGAGAVVIGLARSSPWRRAGLRFKDLIVAVDDQPVAHPQVLLHSIATKDEGEHLNLTVLREGEKIGLKAAVAARVGRFESFTIPLLYNYEAKGDHLETSFLYGLFGYEETAAAWEFTFLWFITFSGGDGDELEEVDS